MRKRYGGVTESGMGVTRRSVLLRSVARSRGTSPAKPSEGVKPGNGW